MSLCYVHGSWKDFNACIVSQLGHCVIFTVWHWAESIILKNRGSHPKIGVLALLLCKLIICNASGNWCLSATFRCQIQCLSPLFPAHNLISLLNICCNNILTHTLGTLTFRLDLLNANVVYSTCNHAITFVQSPMKDMLPQDNSLTTRINKIKVIIGFQPISEQHSILSINTFKYNPHVYACGSKTGKDCPRSQLRSNTWYEAFSMGFTQNS